MPKFTVTVARTETYTGKAAIEADTPEEANEYINAILTNEGWDGVEWEGDDEGEYEDCDSEVVRVALSAIPEINLIVPMTIPDNAIHADWYCDGWEDTEQCWRMDFSVRGNAFQAQLFARVDPEQCNADGDYDQDMPRAYEHYVDFRLFIERDNRDAGGEKRVDYACQNWPIDPGTAVASLAMGRDAFAAAVDARAAHVAALPNDPEMCNDNGRPDARPPARTQ